MRTVIHFAKLLLICAACCLCFTDRAYADWKEVEIPANVAVVEAEAFAECVEITHVTIPKNVKQIREGAFSGCTKLSQVNYDGTKEEWEEIIVGSDNAPLNDAKLIFLGGHSGSETVRVNGKEYTAVWCGREDISVWNERYVCRDFWRLENAYEDFQNCSLTGDNLPESNYPVPIENGQVFVIDYTLKAGGVFRELMRCDGDLWEGILNTKEFRSDAPLRTESMNIGGKDYLANYYGRQDISAWSDTYAYRDFWRLENAYEDFQNCSLTGESVPESNYPMTIESGQVFVIDYTLKDGGVSRRLMRCDGDLWEGMLNTKVFRSDAPLRTESMNIGGKDYVANYYGRQDISSWSDTYAYRDFWRLENAYEDFQNCSLTGEALPENNYPMAIESGQVFVIDYSLKEGGVTRRLMRCDGDLWEGMLITHAFTLE